MLSIRLGLVGPAIGLILLLLVLPGVVQAQLRFTTNSGAITITGYQGSPVALTIPSETNNLPVTGIGEQAFAGCFALASVTIPNSVTSIGDSAFLNCFSLASVTLGNSLTSIGDDAFYDCTSLTSVTIPNSVTKIWPGAFYGCASLTNVTIPHNVTSIGDSAFYYCTSLASVTIGSSVTNIGNYAFFACSSLTTVCFQGNAPTPTTDSTVFASSDGEINAVAYYVPGTTGWGTTFDGVPALPWDIGPRRPAIATTVVTNGFVVAGTITDPGYGYTNAPTLYFVGGSGSGAEATATISNGIVTAINIVNPGSGYTTAPTIAISPPILPNLGIVGALDLTSTDLTIGSSYQLQVAQSGIWTSLGSPFVAATTLYSQLVNNGFYRLVGLPIPYSATATAQLSYGFVVGASITSGGSGYASAPAVSIVGGGGSGASATATVSNGVVTAINIINTGSGYTSLPTIIIAPPTVQGLAPTLSAAVRLDYSSLETNLTYQLQASLSLGIWTNLGSPFTATTDTNSQYLGMQARSMFFRLLYVP